VIKLLRDSGAIILGKLHSQSIDYELNPMYLAYCVRLGIAGKANMTEWANFRQVSHPILGLFSSSQPERRVFIVEDEMRFN
jgi:hypothetical protein